MGEASGTLASGSAKPVNFSSASRVTTWPARLVKPALPSILASGRPLPTLRASWSSHRPGSPRRGSFNVAIHGVTLARQPMNRSQFSLW